MKEGNHNHLHDLNDFHILHDWYYLKDRHNCMMNTCLTCISKIDFPEVLQPAEVLQPTVFLWCSGLFGDELSGHFISRLLKVSGLVTCDWNLYVCFFLFFLDPSHPNSCPLSTDWSAWQKGALIGQTHCTQTRLQYELTAIQLMQAKCVCHKTRHKHCRSIWIGSIMLEC